MVRAACSAFCLALLAATPAFPQSPGSFAAAHLAGGLPTVASPAVRGRGGARVAPMDLLADDLLDPECGCPAQLVGAKQPEVGMEYGSLHGRTADTHYLSLRYVTPLPHRQGLALHRLTMDGTGQLALAPGLSGRLSIEETSLGISWATGDADFAFGLAVSPRMDTAIRVTVPRRGQVLAIESEVLPRPRGRLSLQKKISDRVRAGIDSDLFDEQARLGSFVGTYRTRTYRLGASFLASADTVVGADYEWGEFSGPLTDERLHDLYAGLEHRIAPGWVLRAGSYAGRLALGVGHKQGGVRADIAYVQGISEDLVPLCGDNPSLWTGAVRWAW